MTEGAAGKSMRSCIKNALVRLTMHLQQGAFQLQEQEDRLQDGTAPLPANGRQLNDAGQDAPSLDVAGCTFVDAECNVGPSPCSSWLY